MTVNEVTLNSGGISLVGSFFAPDRGDGYPTICLCHGIPSGQPPTPGDGGYPELAEWFCKAGYAVLVFSFRGAGESGGNIDMVGWTEDVKTAVDYLYELPEVDSSRIALVGFSGGAAVSVVEAAKDKRVAGVAALACPAEFELFLKDGNPKDMVAYFRNIGTIRDDDFPHSPEEWFKGFGIVRPLDYVVDMANRPLLLVHGDKDETVDVSHAYQMYDKASEPKKLVILEGAGHRLRQEERAMQAVLEWLNTEFM